MARLAALPKYLSVLLVAGTILSAQEASPFAFKMSGGPVVGQLGQVFGDAGFSFGGDLEYTRPLGKDASLVYSFGYRAFPGDNQLVSLIPVSVAATGVNPTIYETRNRLVEGDGFFIGAMYRRDVWMDGLYAQGGLKLGRIKVAETDTGTQMVTNGTAIANTNATTAAILAINAIASKREVTATSLGLTVGVGYRISDRYAIEINATQVSAKSQSTSSKSGLTTDFAFSVRF